jgi:nicotinamidase-related amidase
MGSTLDETLELDLARTALVLIDLQERIVALATAPRTGSEVVRNARRLADAFRAVGAPVVLVQTERPGRQPQPPGSGLVPELVPQRADIVITKRTWGAFHDTNLDEELLASGVATLALGGIATNFGVESTARAADERDYRLIFVEDAMAALDAEAHAFAFSYVFPRLGQIWSTEQLRDRLSKTMDTG